MPPSRLLIRAPNWLGDAVMAVPAMAAVRAAFPDTHLVVATIASVAPLFEEDTPAAPDEVIAIANRKEESAALARGEFDAALLLPNSFGAAWTVRRAGIPDRWGYSASLRGWLLTRAIERPSAPHVHQAAYYRELVRGLGVAVDDAPPHLSMRPETALRADVVLARHGATESTALVGFAPGAAYGHAKRWPPNRVADVVTRISREHGALCVLVGARADADAGREIESSLPADVRAVNLIGRTDLRLLIGVLGRCRAFVSNDSGAMHLAAALGVPVAAIFGPTDDRVTAPLGDHDVLIHQVFCRPCMLRDCPIDHRCMRGISADTVFDAVARRMHPKAQSPKPKA
jgi:heptosyltransferase-2